jgi:hypothetical protein
VTSVTYNKKIYLKPNIKYLYKKREKKIVLFKRSWSQYSISTFSISVN